MTAESIQTSSSSRPGQTSGGDAVAVTAQRFPCDGDGGALGHPRVWLTFPARADAEAGVRCPYCNRHFIRAG